MGKTFNYEDLEGWVQKWDKAQEEGIFDKPEGPPAISKQTVTPDYFNLTHDETSEDAPLNECDSKYWSDLYELTKRYGENVVGDYLSGKLNEAVSVDKKSMADSLLSSANPIRPSTVGNDKSLTDPVALGATYDVADLQKLEDLKLRLHGLIDKLNGFDTKGGSVTKLESQIESLQKQIDEMSNGLSKVPSQQGD